MSFWKRLASSLPWSKSRSRHDVAVTRQDAHRKLDQQFDRLLEDFWRDPWGAWRPASDWTPAPLLEEEGDGFTVHLDVPGYEEKDLSISLTNDRLVIEGERSHEESRRSGRQSREEGRIYLALPFPEEVDTDAASAGLKHGILTVKVPKTQTARERVRHIPITA